MVRGDCVKQSTWCPCRATLYSTNVTTRPMEHHKPDARTQQGEAVNASDKPLKATGHDMDRNCAAAGWVGSSKTIAVVTGKAPTHYGQVPNTRVRSDLLVVLLERETQLT